MWKTVKLGDVVSFEKVNGKDSGLRYVGMENISSESMQLVGDVEVPESTSSTFIFDESHVLYGRLRPYLKKVLLPDFKGQCSTEIFCLKPNDALLRGYLAYWLLNPIVASAIENTSTGARMPRANMKAILDFELALPPLAEQQRIVAKLDAAFAEIDEAVKTNLAQARNAKSLFESSRAIFLSAKNEDWAERSLGDCCSRVSVGHVGSTSEYYCGEELGIPFLRSQNVKPAQLELDGVRFITKAFHEKLKKSQLKANDILIVRVGANRGDCCLVPANVDKLNCANIVFARPVEGHPPFMAHFCQSSIGRQRLMGMTTGAAQGVINTKSVATLRIPFPPVEQQKTIARKLDEINERAIELEAIYLERAHQTRLLKSAILAQELQPPQSEAA